MAIGGLSAPDWTLVAAYLGAVLFSGLRAGGRQRSTRDYFLGDRSLPFWAVALSILATETSAATYIGTPASAYRQGWQYLQMVLGFVLARLFLAFYFVRVYYRAEVMTVYGYLKQRFGEPVRVVAAVLFLFGRVIGSGVRLYAACLAVQAAAGFHDERALILTIAALGLIALAYTLLGGIRAVVWTECILGTTLLLGGAVTVIFLLARMPGGFAGVTALPEFADKLRIFEFAPEPGTSWPEWLRTTRPFWIGLGGGFVLNLATHGTDQDIVQRMLTCSDWKKGGLSLVASAALILPLNVLFLSIGSLLYFYHQLRPESVPADAGRPEDYFLLFVAGEMPTGLAGLVLAGLLAVAVSSHTSVLNALASTSIADFYRPHFVREAGERHYLAASRAFTAFWGAVLIVVAACFIGSGQNVLEIALQTLTYFYGSLLGVFLLGIFTRRGNSASATAGMLLAVPVVLLFQAREFLENPALAPSAARAILGALPDAITGAVRAGVPRLAWPLWIVVGTAVSFAIGVAGRPPALSPAPEPPERTTSRSSA